MIVLRELFLIAQHDKTAGHELQFDHIFRLQKLTLTFDQFLAVFLWKVNIFPKICLKTPESSWYASSPTQVYCRHLIWVMCYSSYLTLLICICKSIYTNMDMNTKFYRCFSGSLFFYLLSGSTGSNLLEIKSECREIAIIL